MGTGTSWAHINILKVLGLILYSLPDRLNNFFLTLTGKGLEILSGAIINYMITLKHYHVFQNQIYPVAKKKLQGMGGLPAIKDSGANFVSSYNQTQSSPCLALE